MNDEADMLVLIKTYEENLPNKINEIITLWETLKKSYDPETFTLLHLKIHSLCGSSGLYGYNQLNQITNKLQTIFLSIKFPQHLIENENIKRIEEKIAELKKESILTK